MTDTRIVRISRELPEASNKSRIEFAKEIYSKLQRGGAHRAPCSCPACLFALYQSQPRRPGHVFEKEVFFLSWLAWELQWFKVKVTSAYVGEEGTRYGEEKEFVSLYEHSQAKSKRWILELSDFLKTHKKDFPGIDADPKRMKMKLWRFRKSRLEDELSHQRELQGPKAATWAKTWGPLAFAQHVADFINSRPGRRASFHEVLRRFSSKRESDIKEIGGVLRWNYQLHLRKEGRSHKFLYVEPSREAVIEENKIRIKEIEAEEIALFSEDKEGS